MIPFILATVGGYLLGDSMKTADKFKKGGKVKKLYAILRSPMGEIIADIEVQNEDKMEALKKFREMGINEVGTVSFMTEKPHYYADGGKTISDIKPGDLVEVKEPKYGYDDVYYVVDDKAGYDEKGFLISPKSSRLGDVFEAEQLKKLFAKGGKTKDMSVQFIEYKDKTIMFEPHFKQYFTNDIEFKTLAEAKKYIDAGSPDPSWEKFVYGHGLMAKGGKTTKNFLDELRTIGDLVYSDGTYHLKINENIIDFKYDKNKDEYTIKKLYGYNVWSIGRNLGMEERFSNVVGKDYFTGSENISGSEFKDIIKKNFVAFENYKKSVSDFYSNRESSGTID